MIDNSIFRIIIYGKDQYYLYTFLCEESFIIYLLMYDSNIYDACIMFIMNMHVCHIDLCRFCCGSDRIASSLWVLHGRMKMCFSIFLLEWPRRPLLR